MPRFRSAPSGHQVPQRPQSGRMSDSPGRWEACWTLWNYGGLVDIAKVGAGPSDAMVEALKGFVPREYVAGLHIAQAAGATASTLGGAPVLVLLDRVERCKFVVAATSESHNELLELLQPACLTASPPMGSSDRLALVLSLASGAETRRSLHVHRPRHLCRPGHALAESSPRNSAVSSHPGSDAVNR
jgi:hypothetical protein